MAFDLAGARAAGYSDGEIAFFLGSQNGFDVDGAVKAGYKPDEIVGFLSDLGNKGPAPQGDPLTRVSSSTPDTGAATLTVSPAPNAGAGRGFVNPPRGGPAPTSGSTPEDLTRNFRAGLLGTVAGAGETAASVVAADDVAASLKQERQDLQQDALENGGATIPGKAASVVGSVVPALLLPASKAAQLIGNAGLFAIPAFKDTLEAKLQEGQSFPLALAHAAESFGVNLFMPTVATRGSGAVVKALGGAEATGAKGVATALGQAAGEGATFSAANSVLDKGTDVIAGQQNDRDWVDLKDVAANALGFPALRAAHMAPQAVSAVADRVGTKSQQFGRALGQDVADHPYGTVWDDASADAKAAAAGAVGVNLNPNLANVEPKPADPIAKIANAATVDDAIQAAQEAVDGAAPAADAVQTPGKTLEQELAELRQRTAAPDLPEAAAAPEPEIKAAEPPAEPVALSPAAAGAEPAATWFGRAGDGYKSAGDAQMALPSRLKVAPDLGWKIEQMSNGKFRLAGYAGEGAESPDETAQAQATAAAAADAWGEGRSNPQADRTGVAQDNAPAAALQAPPVPEESGGLVRSDEAAAAIPNGASGERTAAELAQTPADAGVSASGARPYQVERTHSGSLMVRGDKASIREALANLPPEATVSTRDGVQVATTWSDRAERMLQSFDPAAHSDFNGKKVSIKVEAEDGTQATLKMDAGRALRATDARERELERLRECVGAA